MTDKKRCGVCDKLYKDHDFQQLKECWHKTKGYNPDESMSDRYVDPVYRKDTT